LGVDAERVKAHREQHVVAAHALETRGGVRRRERIPVTHVDVARGVREHRQEVEVGTIALIRRVVEAGAHPFFLPLRLDAGWVVLLDALLRHRHLAPPFAGIENALRPADGCRTRGRKATSAVPPLVENDVPLRGGAGGIRTRDPHTASVMRSHCATAPIVLRSSTLITDVTPASARSCDSRSRLTGEFGVPGHRFAPTTGSLRQGFRVLLPIAAFEAKV